MAHGLEQLIITMLLSHIARHLQLLVFLFESLVKLWQFSFDVFLDISLLVLHNLLDFMFKSVFGLFNQLSELIKHRIH